MKILVAMHVFNNFGGILNHNEDLIAGLKELGHDVTFAYLKTTAKPSYGDVLSSGLGEGYQLGAGTGLPVHQGLGYISPYYSIKNDESIAKFVKDANKHDIVIWQSIFGFKQSATERDVRWKKMITDVKAKQIVVVHDGNLRKLYSWIHKFSEHFTGLACVHPAAMNQAAFMEVPRNMILNPQDLDYDYDQPMFKKRTNTILAPQTFKRWKHVDDLVAAVPYIEGKVLVAGDGMERAYMASEDKCKPEYYCTKELDPEAPEDRLNKRIWQNALDRGMEYLGFITPDRRDEILNTSKFLLDPSWSLTYGEHFNRSIVDAMRIGTVPIARNYGISDNERGIGTLFRPDVNYLMIPHDVKPKQFGDMVNGFFEIGSKKYMDIVFKNLQDIKHFDRKKVAQQFINLAQGKKDSGFFEQAQKGRASVDNGAAVAAGNKLWDEHFEVPSSIESFFA